MDEHKINKDIYHPYVCEECMNWHIGHYDKKGKKK